MTDRLRKGGSLSGRERNCAFLNLGERRFATISGLSGFDFPDDARALTLVDWNGDGLMDVWTSNRTAPRIRYLENQLPRNARWIQFGLREKGFLDPIGARVELGLTDGRVLLRTLRAGEGFLGQSSRFLHFGLGEASIRSLRVRWPDGQWQDFPVVDPARRYLLDREAGAAKPVTAAPATAVAQGGLEESEAVLSPWIRLPMALAMPPLVARQPDGKAVFFPPGDGRPFLINLWDPTCADCAVELREWVANREQFPTGLRIATLLANPNIDEAVARSFVAENQLPFAWGRLEASSTALLAEFLQSLFQTRDAFAAPASFLVDGQGNLISFSIGKVTVDQVAAEFRALPPTDESSADRLTRVFGKEGVWLETAKNQNLLFVPRRLMEAGQVGLAALYVRRAWQHLSRHRDIDRLLVWIGDEYFKQGKAVEGLKFHLNALGNGTKDPVVMNNVAWQLSTHPDPKVRNGVLAVRWAEKAVAVTQGKEATYFDTLAAAYAENGQFDQALGAVAKGLELAREERNTALFKELAAAGELYRRKQPRRSQ